MEKNLVIAYNKTYISKCVEDIFSDIDDIKNKLFEINKNMTDDDFNVLDILIKVKNNVKELNVNMANLGVELNK